MNSGVIRVGTRGSALARVQTDEVISLLRQAWPDLRIEIVTMVPDGDRRKTARLQDLGRGAFVKGLETGLLAGEIDLAVHSAKDMPSTLPEGLSIVAYPHRKDPRDVIIERWGAKLTELPSGARLGTSSPRRAGQLLAARPDIVIVPIRGNVDTRVKQVGAGDFDGVVLAAAGLDRLGWMDRVSEYLDPQICLPDSGQGALAVEARVDEPAVIELLSAVNHPTTWATVSAERAFVEAAGGGCRVPVSAYAIQVGDELGIQTLACLPDGSQVFRSQSTGPVDDPLATGRAAAEALLSTGADKIMYGTRS